MSSLLQVWCFTDTLTTPPNIASHFKIRFVCWCVRYLMIQLAIVSLRIHLLQWKMRLLKFSIMSGLGSKMLTLAVWYLDYFISVNCNSFILVLYLIVVFSDFIFSEPFCCIVLSGDRCLSHILLLGCCHQHTICCIGTYEMTVLPHLKSSCHPYPDRTLRPMANFASTTELKYV